MFNLRPAATLVALAAALSSLPAMAEEVRYNQISLRAEVNQEVQRDLMLVTLYTEAQDSDPAKLAAQITETLLGCQACRLDFKADAQFENRQYITQGDDGRRVNPETTGAWRVEHEGTDAVTGLDQTGGLQTRNRLTHDRPADALLFHDCGFGGQFVAALELTAANTLGQLCHQLLREAAVFSAGAGQSALIFHPTSISGLLNMG